MPGRYENQSRIWYMYYFHKTFITMKVVTLQKTYITRVTFSAMIATFKACMNQRKHVIYNIYIFLLQINELM